MSRLVEVLLVAFTITLFLLQVIQDRKWKHLMRQLPRVRANIRQRIREELCLDCKVGEPHACMFMAEDEYADLSLLQPSGN